MQRIRWRLVWGLAMLGPLFAVATIFGWIHGWEGQILLVAVIVIGLAIGTGVKERTLAHGFLAGWIAGVLGVEMQALFIDTYFANNPGYAEIEMPFGWSPRVATAVLGPLNAVILGVLAAGCAWTVARLVAWRRRS